MDQGKLAMGLLRGLDGYPESCTHALSVNITQCPSAVTALDANTAYSEKLLNASCTDICRSALQSYEHNTKESCSGVTYTDDDGRDVPISSVASLMYFNFNQTCLMNDGEHCNTFLGNLTANSVNGSAGDKDCNKCSLLKLRDTAQFEYGNGPLVYSKGIYQSYTSSCHFTGYPLTATPTSLPASSSNATTSRPSTAPATPTSPSTCSGTEYKIKPGDTCNSISLSHGVATMQLLMDNDLPAHCANFPKSGSLCIKNKCKVYTVQKGDTCSSVSDAHDISTVQLRAYNPWINVGCYNFNRTIDSQICVDEPGQKYVRPVKTSSTPSVASSAAPVPSNVAANTTTRCGKYYKVLPGEECDVFANKFGISRQDFAVLNPEINTNYCVQPVGHRASSSVSKVAYTSLPDATYSPIFEVTPLAPGTREGCDMYAGGDTLQYDYEGSSQCQSASFFYDVSADKLKSWNPSLQKSSSSGNSSNGTDTCSFSKEYRYCMLFKVPSSTSSVSGSQTSTSVSGSDAPTSTASGSHMSTSMPSASKH